MAKDDIKKAWPKDAKENSDNELANKVYQDSLVEQGFEAKEKRPNVNHLKLKNVNPNFVVGSLRDPQSFEPSETHSKYFTNVHPDHVSNRAKENERQFWQDVANPPVPEDRRVMRHNLMHPNSVHLMRERARQNPLIAPHIKKSEKPMDNKKEKGLQLPLWKGKEILDPTHEHDLEQRSAIHEFEGKHPKDKAEELAYNDYKREHQLRAAASHFAGMKAARAVGEPDEVKKHHTMYQLHMRNLGLDPNGPLPQEVETFIDTKKEPFYRFQAHKGDAFVINNSKPKK